MRESLRNTGAHGGPFTILIGSVRHVYVIYRVDTMWTYCCLRAYVNFVFITQDSYFWFWSSYSRNAIQHEKDKVLTCVRGGEHM